MPGHIEQLHRGLFTAVDPAVMPPGALAKAVNARYRVGDPALWQAEGRRHIGASRHSSTPITKLAGLRWDPGTKYNDTSEQLSQILFHDGDGYRVLPAVDVPADDPGAGAQVISRDGTVHTGNPTGKIQAIQLGSEWVLIDGKQPQALQRAQTAVSGTTRQYLRPLGLPTTGLIDTYSDPLVAIADQEKYQRLILTSEFSLASGTIFQLGFHHYWYTWYNSNDKVEGASTAGAAAYLLVNDARTHKINLHIPAAVIDQAPAGATHLRIYKSAATEVERITEGATTPAGAGWPEGWRVLEVAISTISATTKVSKTTGDSTITDCYEVDDNGFSGSAMDKWVVEQPFYDSDSINLGNNLEIPFNLNGLPPACSTATVFEGALLTNDLTKRNRVRWSLDDRPDSFPDYSFLDFDTDDYDDVICVRALGNVCGVYMRNSVWRIEWLPNSRDPLFTRGRVKDIVDSARGAIADTAVAEFTPPGGSPMHAYVHSTGIYATNLDIVIPLLQHVDWASIAPDPNALRDNCWLINNPDEQRLEFYFEKNVWYIHYDQRHMQDRIPAVTGPIHRSGGIDVATLIRTPSGKATVVTTGATGKIMYEGYGFVDDAEGGTAQNIEFQSRNMYLTQPLNEFRVSDVLLHLKKGGSGGSWHASLITGDSYSEEEVAVADVDLSEKVSRMYTQFALADYVALHVQGTEANAATALNFLAIGYEDYGESETDKGVTENV